MLALYLFLFLRPIVVVVVHGSEQKAKEDYHLFILRGDSLDRRDILLLDRLKRKGVPQSTFPLLSHNPDNYPKDVECRMYQDYECTTKWEGLQLQQSKPIIYETAGPMLFDRRLMDYVEHSDLSNHELYHLGETQDLNGTVMFLFSVRAPCGVLFYVTQTGTENSYKIKLEECYSGDSHIIKCKQYRSRLYPTESNLDLDCQQADEQLTQFDLLRGVTFTYWSSFKVLRQKLDEDKYLFEFYHVHEQGEDLLYRSFDTWSDVTFSYGHLIKGTAWRLPDFQYLGADNETQQVTGPIIETRPLVCFEMYVLMTGQEGLVVEINPLTDEDSPKPYIRKIVHNKHPNKWVLVQVSGLIRSSSIIQIQIIPSDSDEFWAIDYIKECRTDDTRVMLIYDASNKFSVLDYAQLLDDEFYKVVLHGNFKAHSYCSINRDISSQCFPYNWADTEYMASRFKTKNVHYPIDYLCNCQRQTSLKDILRTLTELPPALITTVVATIIGTIILTSAFCGWLFFPRCMLSIVRFFSRQFALCCRLFGCATGGAVSAQEPEPQPELESEPESEREESLRAETSQGSSARGEEQELQDLRDNRNPRDRIGSVDQPSSQSTSGPQSPQVVKTDAVIEIPPGSPEEAAINERAAN